MVDGFKKFLPWGRRHVLALFLCATVLGLPAARAQQAPTFTSIQRDGRISWTSEYAVSYQLQKTTRLDSTNWTNVGSPVAGNGRTLTVTDPAQVTAQAFYRLVASNAFSCGNSGGTDCSHAVFLGSVAMDTRSGIFCTTAACNRGPSVTGCGNGWFRLNVREESSNCSGLRADVALDSPPGVDYDLYVYQACGWLLGSSTSGPGARDSVTYQPIDFSGSDSADLWIEVRFFSGSAQGVWTLRTSGGPGPCY